MSATINLNIKQTTDRFFTMVKSLDEFDQKEVRGIIGALLSPTEREQCFIANYQRARANISTLLEMKNTKHFQAIAMLTRGLFELAVDIKLLDVVPNACEKMIAFVDVEKLRCAREILTFKAANPAIKTDISMYDAFVAADAVRIDALKNSLWPFKSNVKHWSNMTIADRVSTLGAPFVEIYDFE